MKRLTEREFSPHSVEGEAQALLSLCPPHEAAPGMKQRVRARLLSTPLAKERRLTRLAWAAAVVLAASAAAAAGVAIMEHPLSSTVKPGQVQRIAPLAPTSLPTAASVPTTASPTAPPNDTATPATPVAATRPAAPTPSHAAAKPDEVTEANLLFEATRALRREGNPGRATQLLSQYSRQFPHGTLAEEALALSLEAAQARGDGRATALAKRYLATYPNGHFVDKAKRVLERNGE